MKNLEEAFVVRSRTHATIRALEKTAGKGSDCLKKKVGANFCARKPATEFMNENYTNSAHLPINLDTKYFQSHTHASLSRWVSILIYTLALGTNECS